MRTPIPEALKQRTEAIYEDAGYATKSEFIRDAVRHWLNEKEERPLDSSLIEETHFEYSVHSPKGSDNHKITLKPKTESDLRMIYHTPSHPDNSVSLDFDDDRINRETVESALSDIEGISKARFNTDPALSVYVPKDTQRPFPAIVRELFDTLYATIDVETDGKFGEYREKQLQRALDQYAGKL